ncbi:MAG: aminotransferase class V-fold PLP-dependent enzyme [Myxococcales bacterium]|nr:aminotransferase class V-fold PLP-dependent enzyme [Myxococcales bacterium]
MDPVALARHYTAFLRPGRILLTGHSHQAWPDVAAGAMAQAFQDAAEHVDDKWSRVMERAHRVRQAVATRLGGRPEDVALAASTHELVARFLSALPLDRRRHIVTTDGEFHSLDRQLRRLAEAGVEVTCVPADPVDTLAGRLAAAVRTDTAALMASTVLFRTAAVVPGLAEAVAAAQAVGAEVLLDAYHGFNIVPFRTLDFGVDPIFVVAGGYKYAQWGEGACFMRVPAGCTLRPVHTGWFADFEHLGAERSDGLVGYSEDGAGRFAGSTFEPTSVYRAAAVAAFFTQQGLSVERLRALSLAQTGRILDRVSGRLEVLTPTAPEARGGFVAVRVNHAPLVVGTLRQRGIYVDSRGDVLRIGPAPYVAAGDLDMALDHLLALAAPGK